MAEIDQVLKHAQLAHFDNEVTSMIVLMVVRGEPEVHMAIKGDDLHILNTNIDILKTEVLGLIRAATKNIDDRK